MDKSIVAMLHVHGALLASLCATASDPDALRSAFTFNLAQIAEELQSQEMKGLASVWARTYSRHIPIPSEVPKG